MVLPEKSVLLQPFDELITVAADPFAGLLDDRDGIFLSFGCDEQFGIGELELYHISCNINIRITQELFDKGVHERVALPLYNEPCLVFLEFEYLYNHAPIFGNLKTIKVWVRRYAGMDPIAAEKIVNLNKNSRELE